MEHPNATLYRQMVSDFDSGDSENMWETLAPDVRWHEAGNPDVIEGRDAVRERLAASTELDSEVEVHDVLANDEHVLAMLKVSLTSPTGARVDYPVVEVAHVTDGKITERWSFMDECPADVTAFFASLGG